MSEITVIAQTPKTITIVVNRGEKGDPGTGSSVDQHNNSVTSHADLRTAIGNKASPYTHLQSTLSTTWTINHNLNRPTSITTFNSIGAEINGTVTANGLNVSSVVFAIAVNGSAYCI